MPAGTRRLRPEGSDRPELSLDAEEYLSYLSVERGRAPRTISSYRRDLSAYEDFLRGRAVELSQVSPPIVQDYMAFMAASGLAASSRARALAAIRGLHGFAQAERGAAHDPTEDLEGPRVPQGLPKALSEPEVERLLGAVQGEGARALRDRAMLELLYATGARISEVVGLSLRDMDFEASLVRLFGKGSKERIVPVGRVAVRALLAWLGPEGRPVMIRGRRTSRDDAEALFVSTRGARMSRQAAWTVVRTHALSVGLADRVSPHVLRHSCATHMLDHGADIRVVQELLGHASITTTQVYTKVSQEHLRRAYVAAHPRARASRRAGPP
ncbi:MAG: xerD [Acidimicrobiaceae bacterium]|nr:xerD [Acidimicrobiaceae bacterium]